MKTLLISAFGVSLLFSLQACGPSPVQMTEALVSVPTSRLCTDALVARDVQLLAIEAELGVRGAMQCTTTYGTTRYVGERTGAGVGTVRFPRSSPPSNTAAVGATNVRSNDRNCSDFGSPAEAQRFFLSQGGPQRDPHNLDRDGDGFACEWGTQVRQNYGRYQSSARTSARSTPRAVSSGRCYVGPRGGTYTITASGNRNYGGC